MSGGSDALVPGLPLTREQALALPGMRRYRLVEFLVRWEHFGAARELLESLVELKAGQFFYQYRLAQCCLATGDLERAREVARELYAAPSTRAIGTLAIGDVFYVEGRLARAEEYYRQALEVEKTRESAQRRLAWCLLHRRNVAGATALVEQLAAGKQPAQLGPAAVRLLAAVAHAAGRAEQAAALRRQLKQRWQQEIDRLRASLELAAGRASSYEEPSGLAPAATEAVPMSEPPAPSAPAPEAPNAGYVYPTARERRAAAEAAARREARQTPEARLSSPAFAAAAPERAAVPPAEKSSPTRQENNSSTSSESISEPFHGGAIASYAGCFGPAAPATKPRNGTLGENPPAQGAERFAPGSAASGPIQTPHPEGTRHPKSIIQNQDAPDSGALRVALQELFGYDQFRPGQEEVVRHILAGRSVLATMPTGRGKSLCFQLPAMLLPRTTVVISPLIALMQDQIEGLPPRVRQRATFLNSSLETIEVEQRLRQLAAGRYQLVYAAPERLRQRPFLHALRGAGVSLLVVDEAHCISLWGQDFRPDYLFLPKLLGELAQPPLLAMTATATPPMQADIREQFGVPMESVSQGVFRPNLRLSVQRCPNRQTKLKSLREWCRAEPGAIIVYVNARARAEHLSLALNAAGVSAGFYHAGLPGEQREAAQQRFMQGELRCLVATVAFGMGVDKPDIRLIVHHDLPRSLEGYYQEAGRAGRDGRPARCVLFASPGDKGNLTRWARENRINPEAVLRVHRALERTVRALTVGPDDLERETGLEETPLRVAISVLERAGALRRQYDLPRVCTLQVLREGDAPFNRFVAAARLRPRQRVTRDTEELCALTGLAPDTVEARLLEWAEARWLDYRGSARGLRLEPLTIPDLGKRVREVLQAMEGQDAARLARLDDYVGARTCRHRFLSAYFGHPRLHWPEAPGAIGEMDRCGTCDNCRGSRFDGGR